MHLEKILFTIENQVATITLNNPATINALDNILVDELSDVLLECENNTEVKVIIIEGAGKGFSSGGDLSVMGQALKGSIESLSSGLTKLNEVALQMRNMKKPLIASIHGACAGAGWNLALLCDFRISSEQTRFVQSFINVGLIPDMGGSYVLTKLVGAAKATELFMTGKMLSATDAEALGLVTKVVSNEELKAASLELALELSKKPGGALAAMKVLVNEYSFKDLQLALNLEFENQTKLAVSKDFKEGVMAFIEKREPVFGK